MAYPRRPSMSYRRKSVYRRKSTSPFKKVMKSPSQALPSIYRTVQKLKRKVLAGDEVVQYNAGVATSIGNLAGQNQYVYPLSKFSNWTRVFGADASDEQNNQMLWRKTNIDCEIDNNGERNNVDYSMYLVSLTKAGATELLNPATGDLVTPLQIGVHFQVNGSYGLGFLNKKYFNVHQCKRFITGIQSGLSTETASLRKRMYFKLIHGKGKGFYVRNPSGDWKAKPSPMIPGQNLFIIILNNDSTADTAVQFRASILHTIEV